MLYAREGCRLNVEFWVLGIFFFFVAKRLIKHCDGKFFQEIFRNLSAKRLVVGDVQEKIPAKYFLIFSSQRCVSNSQLAEGAKS